MGQVSGWMACLASKAIVSPLGYLTVQEQMNHQSILDRYNFFMSHHMHSLVRLKFKHTSENQRPQDTGKYFTSLMAFGSSSTFFFELYTEMQKTKFMFENYISDYFTRQRFERVHVRDNEIFQMNPEDRIGIKTGFSGFPEQAYRRLVDQQQRIHDGIISDLHHFTFQFLDLEESAYISRLSCETIVWNHHQALKRSHSAQQRNEAELLESPFIAVQYEIIKFKKLQKCQREISMEELQSYLRRLKELKNEAYKPIYKWSAKPQSSSPRSAFDFLDEARFDIGYQEQTGNAQVRAIMVFDILYDETKIRPDQIQLKLEEVGHQVQFSELLSFNMFV